MILCIKFENGRDILINYMWLFAFVEIFRASFVLWSPIQYFVDIKTLYVV